MSVQRTRWGALDDGTPVDLFTLTNSGGMKASIATYGGILTRLTAPDRDGNLADVTLGFDTLEEYVANPWYFGCLIGRVANRVSHARFVLNGKSFELEKNCGEHHLHGGCNGFHKQVWDSESIETDEGPSVRLRHVSPDREMGYPGKLECSALYTLTADGLRLDFKATTDKATVVNTTHHSYFNLSGLPGKDCLGHELCIPASRVLEVDTALIPTGQMTEASGTHLDFMHSETIGRRIADNTNGRGYDHYYVLDDSASTLRLAATVLEPGSGRGMEVWTTSPGVQFYSGDYIPDSLPGKGGLMYHSRSGFCLEAQGFVDAPNQPGFPEVSLEPGQEFVQTILFKFFVK
nr:aldose epimerase family protein [uncultured Pseudodesulfovibrio sp.]